jgi:hypothetical protein
MNHKECIEEVYTAQPLDGKLSTWGANGEPIQAIVDEASHGSSMLDTLCA